MNARDALNRFIDARLNNYPYGISQALLDQIRAEKEIEERLLLLVKPGDLEGHKQLLEAIITKGLKLTPQQVELREVGDDAQVELTNLLESGRKVIACLGIEVKDEKEWQNLCLSYSLQEISSQIEKKREFWNALQKFMALD